MKLYHHPNCSTCKKAIRFLAENDIDVEPINLLDAAPSIAELQMLLSHQSGNVRALFNTSGMQYRELDMKTVLPTLSSDEALALLAGNGLLVKRPLLIEVSAQQACALVGFKPDQWAATLGLEL